MACILHRGPVFLVPVHTFQARGKPGRSTLPLGRPGNSPRHCHPHCSSPGGPPRSTRTPLPTSPPIPEVLEVWRFIWAEFGDSVRGHTSSPRSLVLKQDPFWTHKDTCVPPHRSEEQAVIVARDRIRTQAERCTCPFAQFSQSTATTF